MRYRSTRTKDLYVSAKEAILRGLAEDGGLFMPESFPQIINNLKQHPALTFSELASIVARPFLQGDLSDSLINDLCADAFNFPVPLVEIEKGSYVLELFHGPSLAFKDFGARFMARCMSAFLSGSKERTVLLVATSGDTGGAVAQGFLGVPGIEVVVLYPSGKVSGLQEKQFTTLGGNVTALEVKGTFDDCQRMVKELFSDKELTSTLHLASANSINIARLIPQSFYYFWAASQLGWPKDLTFITPSGNFGNLTAGIFAERMGLEVAGFVAATNPNDTVPEYLLTGQFKPRPSVETLSNAMDVGNPSNFERLMDLFGNEHRRIGGRMRGVRCTDAETLSMMREVKKSLNYTADPHTAVGLFAEKKLREGGLRGPVVTLSTAHPAKFKETVAQALGHEPLIPETLAQYAGRQKVTTVIDLNAATVKSLILR